MSNYKRGYIGNGHKVHLVSGGTTLCGSGVFTGMHRLGSMGAVSLTEDEVTCQRCLARENSDNPPPTPEPEPEGLEVAYLENGTPVRVGYSVHGYGIHGEVLKILPDGCLVLKSQRRRKTIQQVLYLDRVSVVRDENHDLVKSVPLEDCDVQTEYGTPVGGFVAADGELYMSIYSVAFFKHRIGLEYEETHSSVIFYEMADGVKTYLGTGEKHVSKRIKMDDGDVILFKHFVHLPKNLFYKV